MTPGTRFSTEARRQLVEQTLGYTGGGYVGGYDPGSDFNGYKKKNSN
jgi:hypothetical protein